jgi:hypothetical protein
MFGSAPVVPAEQFEPGDWARVELRLDPAAPREWRRVLNLSVELPGGEPVECLSLSATDRNPTPRLAILDAEDLTPAEIRAVAAALTRVAEVLDSAALEAVVSV